MVFYIYKLVLSKINYFLFTVSFLGILWVLIYLNIELALSIIFFFLVGQRFGYEM